MAIYVNSCAAQETIVITTRSSVYELVVLRGDRGDVMVRGGGHFTEVTLVLFLGSIAGDGSVEPHTIGIGLRMTFVSGDRFVITSWSSPSPAAAQTSPHWSAYQSSEVGVPRESRSSLTLADAGGHRDPPQAA